MGDTVERFAADRVICRILKADDLPFRIKTPGNP